MRAKRILNGKITVTRVGRVSIPPGRWSMGTEMGVEEDLGGGLGRRVLRVRLLSALETLAPAVTVTRYRDKDRVQGRWVEKDVGAWTSFGRLDLGIILTLTVLIRTRIRAEAVVVGIYFFPARSSKRKKKRTRMRGQGRPRRLHFMAR
jgi:hypothetical protein